MPGAPENPMADPPGHLVGLNAEQLRAVTAVDGPLLILAGAGSGKTRVLTRRIAHLIHLGVAPESILAVTFTNKAAQEMKERVSELIGEAGTKVWVSTFHSTCARILRQDIEPLGWTRRFAIYDDDDQLRLIREIVGGLGFDKSVVAPRDVMSQIDHYKNRGQTPDDVVRTLRARVNDPVVRVWREYADALRAADALDFNDLIGTTVRLFSEVPAAIEKWRARFRYVLVDEYQDTNRGQYDLLRLLGAEHGNLGVVGDDDQSIYGFRGADVSNILNFQRDWPSALVVRLEQNYRSTGNILTLANAVVAQNPNRLEKSLWTEAAPGARINLYAAETAADEAKWVARAILQLKRFGNELGQIAIIYRTNAISRTFEFALREHRIAYRIVGGKKFYERREIRDLLAYLRLVVNPADDAAFLRVINVPSRGIGSKTLQALRDDATARGEPLLPTARLRAGSHKGIAAFVGVMDDVTRAARDEDPPQLVARLIERSGYAAMLEEDKDDRDQLSLDAKGRLDNLAELVRDAGAFDPPPEALTPMERLTSWLDRIALAADTDEIPAGGEVTLMTVHSSKGLEYPVVFVVQMSEGIFPHARSEETAVDEERRLAYVAFTRAMTRLVITRSRQLPAWGGRGGEFAAPSQFLMGLPGEVCEGDLPDATPAQAEPAPDVRARKLAAFVERRRGGGPEPTDDDLPAWTRARPLPAQDSPRVLLEIEDAEELGRGVRVHHARFGVGAVLHRAGGRVQIAFERGGPRWVPLGGTDLHRVGD
jgi:DNA helicase-2/ATP-dependent DNA helicase PcrA